MTLVWTTLFLAALALAENEAGFRFVPPIRSRNGLRIILASTIASAALCAIGLVFVGHGAIVALRLLVLILPIVPALYVTPTIARSLTRR